VAALSTSPCQLSSAIFFLRLHLLQYAGAPPKTILIRDSGGIAARRLYEAYGFVLEGEAINRWGSGEVQHLKRLGGRATSQESPV
jgi:ribosomal protein S18 acetylase RimI-like enzyme